MNKRRAFIAGNWKMNKTVSEARDFIRAFLPSVRNVADRDIVLAPPFTALSAIAEMVRGLNVILSAQNVFYEEKGAFTGEVSVPMLRELGCAYVILGHSERRQYFNETDETVNKKIMISLKHGLGVIVCIGELLGEREDGRTYEVLERQITKGLKGVKNENLVIAYEPVWAIGTGRTATPEQAQEAHEHIRARLRDFYGNSADSLRILYGGSVTPENIDSLMACPDVDGALVGGASLKPESFEMIVKFKGGIA
jgi:triosephosphate isomerase (TIM)